MRIARNTPLLALLMFLATAACCQHNAERTTSGKSHAQKVLMDALAGKPQHNVVDNKNVIIKDSAIAVSVAEPVLFEIYGKDNILHERPYQIHFIDHYWIMWGTLPEHYVGGTFWHLYRRWDNGLTFAILGRLLNKQQTDRV